MNKIKVVDAKYSDVEYLFNQNKYQHNIEADYACFAIWKKALPFIEDIRKHLSTNFNVLLETKVVWSEENLHDNATRLYESPMLSSVPKKDRLSGHVNKIGGNSFILFVLKDEKPNYNHAVSVSKKIELTNLNFVKAKYLFRNWAKQSSGANYAVHSTNNIHEFFFQAPLILGIELYQKVIAEEKINLPELNQDLVGANGWNSWTELFDILNLTTNYLVLRNYEDLPEKNLDGDVDFLTDNFQRLASALGLEQLAGRSYKGFIKVNKEKFSIDIRFNGDRYYNTIWALDMLKNKQVYNSIFVPRIDDYFFSLLFHCKVQKKAIKPKYKKLLLKQAEELNFTWFNDEVINDEKLTAELLGGFMSANSLYYEEPLDDWVYENKQVIEYLPTLDSFIRKESNLDKVKRIFREYAPNTIVNVAKQIWKIIKK